MLKNKWEQMQVVSVEKLARNSKQNMFKFNILWGKEVPK